MIRLTFISYKFKLNDNNENAAELRIKIRDHINKNFANWKKSSNGEYLFYGVLMVLKPTKLSDLNKTELKALASFYNIQNIFHLRKAEMEAIIEQYFSANFPNHERVDNELLFSPDTEV